MEEGLKIFKYCIIVEKLQQIIFRETRLIEAADLVNAIGIIYSSIMPVFEKRFLSNVDLLYIVRLF